VSSVPALGKEGSHGPLCQFLCRVSAGLAFINGSTNCPFVTCSFASVLATTLVKEALSVHRCAFFVECYGHDTRQNISLPSVTLGKVTRIPFLFVFVIPSKQTKDISHNHHIYITDITESSHTSNTRHSSQRSHVCSQSHKYHKIVHNTHKYSHK
jgi:hypothetical protein